MMDAVAIPRLGDDLSLPASSFSNDYHSHFGNILARIPTDSHLEIKSNRSGLHVKHIFFGH